jgi:hypothetical protein
MVGPFRLFHFETAGRFRMKQLGRERQQKLHFQHNKPHFPGLAHQWQ